MGIGESASVPNIYIKYCFPSLPLRNFIFKSFALHSNRSDADQQTRPETFLFFKYIILVQSYRYIHCIINNIYKNIKHNIYDCKIKWELFTLNICTKLWMIAGGVTGGLNIKVGSHMLSRVTSTRRQPVDQKIKKNPKKQMGRLFSQPALVSPLSNFDLALS